ncbi:MAG TPA: hypothetical protein VJ794_06895 [Gemmatimonadales bacterium]|nr:hypothetical protein [Gemmatimonadales bacterium]
MGDDVAEHRAQVLDPIGAKGTRAAGHRDVELGWVEHQLDAEAGLQALDPPDPVELLLLLLVLLLVLRGQRSRGEIGSGRECQGERGEADGGNAVLRG